MYPLLVATLMLTSYPAWESKEIYTSWTPQGQGYEYVLEIFTDRTLSQPYITKPPSTLTYTNTILYETNLYFQRVTYYHKDTPQEFGYEYLGQFYINLYYGLYTEDIPDIFPEDEPDPPTSPPTPTPIPPSIPTPAPSPPPSVQKTEYVLPSNVDNRESVQENSSSVLGIQKDNPKEICNISVFREKEKSTTSINCDLDIQITGVKYLDWERYLTVETEGTYPERVNAAVKVYECKKFTLLDPDTWFRCIRIVVDSYDGSMKILYTGHLLVDGKVFSSNNFAFYKDSFFLKNTFKEDISKKNIKVVLNMYSQVKGRQWIDVKYVFTKDVDLPRVEKVKPKRPFTYPLDRLIGVTQWHGCTHYQCPHKGIDFGARLNRVLSIGDGTVVNVGFDKYGGECNQGGKYVIVKHTNGMHSVYFHLDSYSVKVGQKVKKGEAIAISGNTGKKNCQNFAYHLHFETRKERSSSTHVNPVPYIDVDWNMVPTLGIKQFPGRLTGDNPHPNF